MTEEELIQDVQGGRIEAYRELVEKYERQVFSIAYSLVRNREEACDISQEAFIKAFRSLRHFKLRSSFYTWLYRILVNLCRDWLRKKSFRDKFLLSRVETDKETQEGEGIFELLPDNEPGPREQLLNKELGGKLTEAINSLPEKQKTVFILKNIHGLSIREIAHILKCAQGTVKAQLWQAISKLQVRLDGYLKSSIEEGR